MSRSTCGRTVVSTASSNWPGKLCSDFNRIFCPGDNQIAFRRWDSVNILCDHAAAQFAEQENADVVTCLRHVWDKPDFQASAFGLWLDCWLEACGTSKRRLRVVTHLTTLHHCVCMQASSQVSSFFWGGQNTFLGVFVFIICSKQIFLDTVKFGGHCAPWIRACLHALLFVCNVCVLFGDDVFMSCVMAQSCR